MSGSQFCFSSWNRALVVLWIFLLLACAEERDRCEVEGEPVQMSGVLFWLDSAGGHGHDGYFHPTEFQFRPKSEAEAFELMDINTTNTAFLSYELEASLQKSVEEYDHGSIIAFGIWTGEIGQGSKECPALIGSDRVFKISSVSEMELLE